MVAIPVLKLFSLTVKTLAKPMSKRIKSEAQKNDYVRGILNRMGQTVNSISLRINIRMAGHKTTKIKPLEEDKAVANGGELLAEGFVYSVAGALVVWEYMSSAQEKEQKDTVAKAKKAKEHKDLEDALEAINRRLQKLEEMAKASKATALRSAEAKANPAPTSFSIWRSLGTRPLRMLGFGRREPSTTTSIAECSVEDEGTVGVAEDVDSEGRGKSGGQRLKFVVSEGENDEELKDRGMKNGAAGNGDNGIPGGYKGR